MENKECPTLKQLTDKDLHYEPKYNIEENILDFLEDNNIVIPDGYETEESIEEQSKIQENIDNHLNTCQHEQCKSILANRKQAGYV